MTIERKPSDKPRNPAMEKAMRDAGLSNDGSQKQPEETARPVAEKPAAQQQHAPRQQQQQQQSSQPRGNENRTMSQTDFSSNRRTDSQAFTLGDADRLHRRPVARHAGSQRLRAVSDAFQKELTASLRDGENSFKVVTLDQSQTRLAVPVILLVQAARAANESHAAVFSFLLDSPDIRLAPRLEKVDGRTIEVTSVLGDVYNSKDYWARIEGILADQFRQGAGEVKLHDAGGMVIPGNFNVDTDDVHELVYRSTVATWTVMNTWVQLDAESAFSVAGRSRNELLTARLNFSGETLFNAVKQPVRSDVTVELDSSVQGQGQEAFMVPTQMLVTVGGFLQPMYAQPNPNANPNGPRDDQPYWSEFVITQIDSGYESADLEVFLLAISTATILSNNYAWADAYRPRYRSKAKSDEDLRDIGAIGYALVPQGGKPERIDTRTEAFLPEFPQLIRDTFRNGLLYSLDAPEIGENAWALDVFRAAANGVTQAYNQIFRAANNLTGGAFGELFQQGQQIVSDNNNRIHLGQYVRDGQLRDIRDIDYLAVLNIFGKTSPKTAIEFAETFSPKTGPLASRLDTRLKIIHEALQGDYQLTGYANRLNLFGDFVAALNTACDRAGLVVNPANIGSIMGSGQIMGGYDVGQFAVRGNLGGVFANRNQGYDAQGAYGGRGGSRFGN